MLMHTSDRTFRPLRQAKDRVENAVRRRPQLSIGGVVAVAAIVAFGIWIWPEVHRTIRIHRM
jgi:hypothetical protein